MKRYVEGENRFQSTLFPENLEDYAWTRKEPRQQDSRRACARSHQEA
jgi:hypothetical protein